MDSHTNNAYLILQITALQVKSIHVYSTENCFQNLTAVVVQSHSLSKIHSTHTHTHLNKVKTLSTSAHL